MKAPESVIRNEVRSKFSLSSRATSWVSDSHRGNNLSKHSREHLSRNGGVPSESAVNALAWLNSQPIEQLYLLDQIEDPNAGFYHWTEDDKLDLLEMHNPAEHEKELATLMAAGDAWWNREGKYEEAAEEQGTYKEYLYECQRAQQFGEDEPHISNFVRL